MFVHLERKGNGMTSRILHGCLGDRIPELIDEGVLVDSIVTDPPYHLTTGKKGGTGPASVNLESPYGRARVGTGFMGMTWDGGDVALRPETWSLALDILKPGGHLLAFGGTRTHHRLMCAIEDAGFELRDVLMWVYSSGFPKSMNSHRLKGEHFCDCESTAKREVHPMRDADVPAPLAFGKGQGPVLQHGVVGKRGRVRLGRAFDVDGHARRTNRRLHHVARRPSGSAEAAL